MATTFTLELVTPEKIMFSEPVQAVRAPGIDGSLGILAHHAPMLTELTVGLIKLTLANGQEALIATGGGFMQVNHAKTLILADSAELSEQIDVERARKAVEAARSRLAAPGVDAAELHSELARAENRLRVAQLAK